MFPNSEDEFLSNMLIGPCGIGWSLDNGRLTMTLGPWLNRDWGGEKLNWAKDFFHELLSGHTLLGSKEFIDQYGIPEEDLNFLAQQGYISGFDKTSWLRTHQDGLLPIDTAFDDFFRNGEWQKVSEIQSLVDQILDKIKRESSEGRLQEAAPSVFKQMYPESLICTISGYVVPDPIGSNRLHTVRLRRPDTATHQPVLDEPTRPNLKGWESIGNTLYVSDRASQTGQRLDDFGYDHAPAEGFQTCNHNVCGPEFGLAGGRVNAAVPRNGGTHNVVFVGTHPRILCPWVPRQFRPRNGFVEAFNHAAGIDGDGQMATLESVCSVFLDALVDVFDVTGKS